MWIGWATTSTLVTLISVERESIEFCMEFVHFVEGLHITITRDRKHHEHALEMKDGGHGY